MDVFIVDASTYDDVHQQLLKFRDNIKIVNTYKPNSELDASHKANSTENGVGGGGGANGAKVGEGRANRSSGSGPPAVSVVTFRWAGTETNKRKRAR